MRQTDLGDASAFELRFQHLDVDLTGLTDFQRMLRHELDANIRPSVEEINKDHGVGVQFGARIAGAGIQGARERYHSALVASTQNLTSYARRAEVLIDAIETLTTRYRDSDLSAEIILTEITRARQATFMPAEHTATAGYVPPSLASLDLNPEIGPRS